MNPCIKTGANVFITSHGTVLHGDLYKLEGVYVLRYNVDQPFNDDPKAIRECFAKFDDHLAEVNSNSLSAFPPLMINFDAPKYGTLILHHDYVECEA